MDESTLHTLDYREVLAEVARCTTNPIGHDFALSLKPLNSTIEAERALALVQEASLILSDGFSLPCGGIEDIRPLLDTRRLEGFFLEGEVLYKALSTLKSIRALRAASTADLSKKYKLIPMRLSLISNQGALLSALDRALAEGGEVKDSASDELYSVRKRLKRSKAECRRILESMVSKGGSADEGAAEDEFVTIRDDRFVVALRAGRHAGVKGVVHGRSKSGGMFFVEPLEAVEINNRVTVLKREEEAEVIKVLRKLTTLLLDSAEEILRDLAIAGEVDLIQAKVHYMRTIGGIIPEFSKGFDVLLKGARHPALIQKAKVKGAGKEAVPVDIEVSTDTGVLVISGANAGGKTVALKTLGLLTLMAESALPISALEGTKVAFFRGIYTDIGDRQNIAEDLSTFTAHLKRMGEILNIASEGTLVLIDEIGVGTDPAEGSVLSLAMLEALRDKGAKTVVTTHLNLIKAKAELDPDFRNAAVIFDEDTLKPLYALEYGTAGRSLGISVASAYGIPDDIIEKARQGLRGDEGTFVDSIRAVKEKSLSLEKELKRVNELALKRERELKRLRDNRERFITDAKKRIDSVVLGTKEKLSEVLKDVASGSGKRLDKKKAFARVEALKEEAEGVLGEKKREEFVPKVGDNVIIKGTGTEGVVVKIDEAKKTVEVKCGVLKFLSSFGKLEKSLKPTPARAYVARGGSDLSAYAAEAELSVNIIGMRVPEAMDKVTDAVDRAHVSGVHSIDIIHGVGAGILKKAVEEFLKGSRHVKSCGPGDELRGGAGVTVVELI